MLVAAKVRTRIFSTKNNKSKLEVQYYTSKLRDPQICLDYKQKFSEGLNRMADTDNIESSSTHIKKSITEANENVLGSKPKLQRNPLVR